MQCDVSEVCEDDNARTSSHQLREGEEVRYNKVSLSTDVQNQGDQDDDSKLGTDGTSHTSHTSPGQGVELGKGLEDMYEVIDEKIQDTGNVIKTESGPTHPLEASPQFECYFEGCGQRFSSRELIAHMDKESADAMDADLRE